MRLRKIISACMVAMTLGVVPAIPAFQAGDTTTAVTKKVKPAPAKIVPESEITAAKAAGKVWVNTDTGVYHKGGKWYGATKEGKFMTEQDAVKAGYRAAKTK